ncbi:MAG: nitrogen regulation protein NR(II) [Candidatus Binatia bacterium]
MRNRVAEALELHQQDIVDRWIARAGRLLGSQPAQLSLIGRAYAEGMRAVFEQGAADPLRASLEQVGTVGEEHGLSMAQTHNLLFAFKQATLDVLLGQRAWQAGELTQLHACLDQALALALSGYAALREERMADSVRTQWLSEIERGRRTVVGLLAKAQKAEERLHVQEELLSTVVRECADAIITLDAAGIIRSWNAGAQHLLQYAPEEIIGRPFTNLVPPELIEQGEWDFLHREVLAHGAVRDFETERLGKNGKRVRVAITCTALRDGQGQYIGSSTVIRDVTERKALETQLAHADRLATMGTMAAGLAHEIGNPLGAISSLVQVLQRRVADPDLLERLHVVRQQVSRITTILREVADFSRPGGHAEPQAQVASVIQNAVTLARYTCSTPGVEVIVNLEPGMPAVPIEAKRLLQVFLNLVLNAYDAMRGDGRLWIDGSCRNGAVAVKFSDCGPGVPVAMRERIFEPFFTTKAPGRGTGMGLPVSQRIVQACGGNITINQATTGGAAFTVTLPIGATGGRGRADR